MAAVSFDEKILAAKSIICDVEGTTSSISFVKDTLFPYALKNLEEYLKANWNEDATKTVVAALREQADEDKKAELEGVVTIPAGDSEDIIPDIVKNVEWQMSLDRKTGSLKTLQGLVWAKGYKDGSIKGHVYDDVSSAFEKWTESGRKIYVYSSGSVDAQKLLFEHSEKGDLVKYLTGHYDTKVGAKQEKDSYDAILKSIEATAEEVLFLTDVVAEAKAAKEAGLNVVVLDRPGNAELSEEDRKEYTVISSFADIPFESIESANGAGKRKIDEAQEEDEAQPPTKVVKVNENGDKAPAVAAEEQQQPAKTNGDAVDAKVADAAPAAGSESMEVDAAQDEKAKTTAEPEVTNKTDDSKEAEQESPKEAEVSKTDDEKKVEVVEEPKKSEEEAKVEESSTTAEPVVAAAKEKEEEKMEVDGEAVAAAAEDKEAEKKEDKPVEKVAEESEADVTSTEPANKEEKPVKPVVESTTEAEPAKPSTEAEKVEKKKPTEEAKETPVETMETDSTTAKEPEVEPKKEEAKAEEVKPVEAEPATKPAESAEEVKPAEETKGEEATTAGPVDEVAVEAKATTAAEKEETKKADSEEVSTTSTESAATTTTTKENGTHQNGVSEAAAAAAPVNGKEEPRVPENGEAEPAATNGSNGNAHSDEKGDSDKENDTAKTNVEEAAASGTENGSSTTTTTTPAAVVDAATEIKTKKVIDSSTTTSTPPIEADA